MTSLRLLDASMKQLNGTIPDGLCDLPLESLNLYENQFEGNLPVSIANSLNLYELRLFGNKKYFSSHHLSPENRPEER